MKLKGLNILFLFFIIGSIQAQVEGEAEYLIQYEVEFLLDKFNSEKVEIETHRLYTGSGVSYYTHEGSAIRDSLAAVAKKYNNRKELEPAFRNIPISRFDAKVYKNLDSKEVSVQYNIVADSYLYQEPNVPLQWEFTEESKEVNQYVVHKAITSFGGRDWEAWFTTDIPIVDGPYVFLGLPGLIIELYDTEKHYQFNVTSIKPLEKSYEIKIKQNNITNLPKDEFVKFYKRHRENPIGSITQGRKMVFIDENGNQMDMQAVERSSKENALRENNYIEIW